MFGWGSDRRPVGPSKVGALQNVGADLGPVTHKKAKDALARSGGIKGDHVPPARAALKTFLQQLNDAKQPDDARFETLIEAPFKTPPKKKPMR